MMARPCFMTLLATLACVWGCAPSAEAPGGSGAALAGADGGMPCPWSAGTQKKLKAFFSLGPQGAQPDHTLDDELVKLIRAATPGSSIRGSMFIYQKDRISLELATVAKRPVDVKMVLDGHNEGNTATKALQSGIGTANVTLCKSGCVGTGINHNKFFLFSRLCDGSKDVVYQSSANLKTVPKHNNTVVIRGDAKLYGAFLKYWKDERAQKKNLNYYAGSNGVTSGSTSTQVRFYPRKSGDAVVEILNKVKCTKRGKRIYVAMAMWNTGRKAIVDRLKALRAKGCDVKIVVGVYSLNRKLVAYLKKTFPRNRWRQHSSLHSKYMVINAKYNGKNQWMVITGSENYGIGSIRSNDNTSLLIKDKAMAARYFANWKKIWNEASTSSSGPAMPAHSFHVVDQKDPIAWDAILALNKNHAGPLIASQNRPPQVPAGRWCRNLSVDWYTSNDGAKLAKGIHDTLNQGLAEYVMVDELRVGTKSKVDAIKLLKDCADTMRTTYPQWRGRWGAYLVHGPKAAYPKLNPAIDALLRADATLVAEMYAQQSKYCQSGKTTIDRDKWLASFFRGSQGAFSQGRYHWLVQRRAALGSSSRLGVVFGVTDSYLDGKSPAVFLDRMFYVWANRSGYPSTIHEAHGGAGSWKWDAPYMGSSSRDLAFKQSFEHYSVKKKTSSRLGPVSCP